MISDSCQVNLFSFAFFEYFNNVTMHTDQNDLSIFFYNVIYHFLFCLYRVIYEFENVEIKSNLKP